MESSVQSESQVPPSAFRSSNKQSEARLTTIRQELAYLNTIGKRFVAAFDRFQVHRALLATLREMYDFSACCILLKGEPPELFIIPSYPLSAPFIEAMLQRIVSAANVIDFPHIDQEQLASSAYLDAPDDLAPIREQGTVGGNEIGSCLNIPLIVENRIIGMLSLFDERMGTFDTHFLQLTSVIADYAAVALENVRLRERENALWRQAEFERQRLALILTSMAEALLITDANGKITSLNESAKRLLMRAKIEWQSERPLEQLAQERAIPWLTQLQEIIGEALKTNRVITNREIMLGENNETVPLTLSVSAAPVQDNSGTSQHSIGVVVVLNDITPSKQVERLKDEFVSVVSHELRTPLTAIKGYTQYLVRRIGRRIRKMQATQEEQNVAELPESYDLRSLSIIQSQTEHLERLVNDLLDLSQVQWGKLQLSYERFNLAEVLAETLRSVQASAEQHTLQLDLQVQDSAIRADRVRIGQVIGNILDNAVKYSPHGGMITVRLQTQEDNSYLVSVVDEGIGVSPEHLNHIFERFYRVHNTTSQHYSGIGLGLYVARAIVEQHGGRIWYTNNQGIGSTFHFTLPRDMPAS